MTRSALQKMLVSLFAIIFAGFHMGQSSQFMPDVTEGKLSAIQLFNILDSPAEHEQEPEPRDYPALQEDSPTPEAPAPPAPVPVESIEFEGVKFRYPSREALVFKGLSFLIGPEQRCAFVGASGGGKSTVVQLLLRFYDPEEGSIRVNGADIKTLPLQQLRMMFGLVSQEPTLFRCSVRDNLNYNRPQPDEQLRAALRTANASFVDSPEGLDREVGAQGAFLSGGQKQRIAIARVIARRPGAYLFDEATSALDTENEAIVQAALDRLMA